MMASSPTPRTLARRSVALLAATGASIGLGCLLATRPVSRVAGLPEQASARWLLRLFGIRELLLSLGLYRSLRRDDSRQARLLAELTALAQVGDVAATAVTALGGGVPRRVVAGVTLGALPTLACTWLIRRGYAVGEPPP
ncbi:hypothetical protein [Candidatus Nephthysia bennettiae]